MATTGQAVGVDHTTVVPENYDAVAETTDDGEECRQE
jgi:hypothetical protein